MRGTFQFVVLPTLAVAETCDPSSAKKLDSYNDKRISQSEMWTVNNLTKPECMFECLKERYCVSFLFSPSGPVSVALRERFEGSTNAHGSALPKLRSDFELEVDCVSLPNSQCNDEVCRCDVDTCRILTECSTFRTNFTLYKDLVIEDHDISNRPSSNYESCPEACITTAGDKSADLDFQYNVCYMKTHTWLGVPVTAHYDNLTFVFFQRECLW